MDGGRKVSETKIGTLLETRTYRRIIDGDREWSELEIEFANEDMYKQYDDEAIDAYLCGGVELGFPGLSDRMFSSNGVLFGQGSCDKVIVKFNGEKKEFKMALFDKYMGKVKKAAKKYKIDPNTNIKLDKTTIATERQSSGINLTYEEQIAMEGLADAANTYAEKKTRSIAGHIEGSILDKLSNEWKQKSTTGDFDRRLEEEKYELEKEYGYMPGSPEYNERLEKFEKTRGRISKNSFDSSGGELDREIEYAKGQSLKDTIASGELSVEEHMIEREREKAVRKSIDDLTNYLKERSPDLLNKLMEGVPLTPSERKRLQRLRENEEFFKQYKDIMGEH